MRLDTYLFEKGYFDSRTKAQESIKKGKVLINGEPVKVSYNVVDYPDIQIINNEVSFVSNGGYKLYKAFNDFSFDAQGLTVADFGASTGGFTDCLLKKGAKKIYAIDVGENQLHKSLKADKRVIIKDNTNVRYIDRSFFEESIDLITADLSFISIKYLIPIISEILDNDKFAIILIKPQFEINERLKIKNGIVKDKKIHKRIVDEIYDCSVSNALTPVNFCSAPIQKNKNIEYLMLLQKSGNNKMHKTDVLLKI